MQQNRFSGIFPALFTAFREDGSINETAIEQIIEMDLKRGVKGFYIGGSSGEAFMMTLEERMLLLRICSDIVGGRATMIAHVGDVSEDKAMRLASFAWNCGYDAISAVTPFYYHFTYKDIKNYYRDLADISGLSMMVYYIPGQSGVNLTLDQVLELMEPDYVLGIKFSCQDLFTLERIKAVYPQKPVLFGVDEMLVGALAIGADGAIGSNYNFVPEIAVGIYNAVASGDLDEARRLQSELNTIVACLFKVGTLVGAKALLEMMGIDVGYCRRPFGRATDAEINMLREKAFPFVQPIK